MTRVAFIVTSIAFTLAACGGAVETVSAGTDGVTIRHTSGYEGSANQQAQANCNNFAKKARMRSSHDDGGKRYAIYDCVPM